MLLLSPERAQKTGFVYIFERESRFLGLKKTSTSRWQNLSLGHFCVLHIYIYIWGVPIVIVLLGPMSGLVNGC